MDKMLKKAAMFVFPILLVSSLLVGMERRRLTEFAGETSLPDMSGGVDPESGEEFGTAFQLAEPSAERFGLDIMRRKALYKEADADFRLAVDIMCDLLGKKRPDTFLKLFVQVSKEFLLDSIAYSARTDGKYLVELVSVFREAGKVFYSKYEGMWLERERLRDCKWALDELIRLVVCDFGVEEIGIKTRSSFEETFKCSVWRGQRGELMDSFLDASRQSVTDVMREAHGADDGADDCPGIRLIHKIDSYFGELDKRPFRSAHSDRLVDVVGRVFAKCVKAKMEVEKFEARVKFLNEKFTGQDGFVQNEDLISRILRFSADPLDFVKNSRLRRSGLPDSDTDSGGELMRELCCEPYNEPAVEVSGEEDEEVGKIDGFIDSRAATGSPDGWSAVAADGEQAGESQLREKYPLLANTRGDQTLDTHRNPELGLEVENFVVNCVRSLQPAGDVCGEETVISDDDDSVMPADDCPALESAADDTETGEMDREISLDSDCDSEIIIETEAAPFVVSDQQLDGDERPDERPIVETDPELSSDVFGDSTECRSCESKEVVARTGVDGDSTVAALRFLPDNLDADVKLPEGAACKTREDESLFWETPSDDSDGGPSPSPLAALGEFGGAGEDTSKISALAARNLHVERLIANIAEVVLEPEDRDCLKRVGQALRESQQVQQQYQGELAELEQGEREEAPAEISAAGYEVSGGSDPAASLVEAPEEDGEATDDADDFVKFEELGPGRRPEVSVVEIEDVEVYGEGDELLQLDVSGPRPAAFDSDSDEEEEGELSAPVSVSVASFRDSDEEEEDEWLDYSEGESSEEDNLTFEQMKRKYQA